LTENRSIALVTGSSSGIGRAAALRLAHGGFNVMINYSNSRSRAEETVADLRAIGIEAEAVAADVSDDSAVQSMITATIERFGKIDVLVNNAGTTSKTPPEDFDGFDIEDWDRVFSVNVRGLFQVTRAATPYLRESEGSIVNVASIVGLRPGPQPHAYAASKAAVVSLTRTLSRILAPEVRVNAVAPGWIAGEWMERTLGENYDRLMERRAKLTPMKRNVTLDDVAEAVFVLATSLQFVTGEIIVVDGGFTATT
jgi:3-oxoacyl-[acyl-carrier protein] reductase